MKESIKPLRVAASLLPHQIRNDSIDKGLVDAEGFIHGYLSFSENDTWAYFFVNGKPLFVCTRPVLVSQTHLMLKYLTAVSLGGREREDLKTAKLCELVFFFNTPNDDKK